MFKRQVGLFRIAQFLLEGVREQVDLNTEIQHGPLFVTEVAKRRLVRTASAEGLPFTLLSPPMLKGMLPLCIFLIEPSRGMIDLARDCQKLLYGELTSLHVTGNAFEMPKVEILNADASHVKRADTLCARRG